MMLAITAAIRARIGRQRGAGQIDGSDCPALTYGFMVGHIAPEMAMRATDREAARTGD
jgi:hypothetical protein